MGLPVDYNGCDLHQLVKLALVNSAILSFTYKISNNINI